MLLQISEPVPSEREVLLLVAPASVKQRMMTILHDKRTSGHLGRDKLPASVKRHLYWPGVAVYIAR